MQDPTNQTNSTISRTIARMLLQIGAVALRPRDPFTWTSGLKSPIYTDNRLTMSYPHIRNVIADAYVDLITREFGHVDVIAGVATAGIPHAAFVAQKMALPMAFIRGSAKTHGKGTLIEGVIKMGDRVVVIEDTFSTGGSSIKAAKDVELAGGVVVGVVAIFSYEFEHAMTAFREAGFPALSLTQYQALIEEAQTMGVVTDSDLEVLQAWRNDPKGFSW